MPSKQIENLAATARHYTSEVYQGNGGQGRANAIRAFIDEAMKEIVTLEARIDDGKPLDPQTLYEATKIRAALDAIGSASAIRQLAKPGDKTPGIYRIDLYAYGEVQGHVGQLVSLLNLLRNAPAIEVLAGTEATNDQQG